MSLLTASLLRRKLFVLSLAGLIAVLSTGPSFASGKAAAPRNPQNPPNLGNSQRVFINPETGERLTPRAAGKDNQIPQTRQKTLQIKQGQEQKKAGGERIIQHEDGSTTIDLNGRFMMPLYGRIGKDGKVILTHEDERKDNGK